MGDPLDEYYDIEARTSGLKSGSALPGFSGVYIDTAKGDKVEEINPSIYVVKRQWKI